MKFVYRVMLLGMLTATALAYPRSARAATQGFMEREGAARTVLRFQVGIDMAGHPSAAWRQALLVFHPRDSLPGLIRRDGHPLTNAERRWARLSRTRLAAWTQVTNDLSVPFGPVSAPPRVLIVVGNVGGQDAFTPADTMIAVDVSRMHLLYGDADDPANAARIDRFFAHEYTHLLHKAWHRDHPVDLSTPLRRALWDCLVEGLGNYRSLSPRWISENGGLSEHAREVLARLEPVFVERLSALADASATEEEELTRHLSMGPFEQKWGALPVALWLLDEARGDEAKLKPWVVAGPPGVLRLARKHLTPDLASALPPLAD